MRINIKMILPILILRVLKQNLDEVGLELLAFLLPQFPKSWDDRSRPPCLTKSTFLGSHGADQRHGHGRFAKGISHGRCLVRLLSTLGAGGQGYSVGV